MTRSLLLPLAAILALATGLGLLGVAATVTQSPITVVSPSAADAALRTGDASALHSAVTPEFVDHAAPPGSRPGAAGYARFLAELRAVCPDCRLATEELAVGADQAAVRVAVRGHRQGTVHGVYVDLPVDWSALEVLRVAGGQIAERWGRGDALSLAEPLVAEVPVDPRAGPEDVSTVQVARFVLRPGAVLPPVTVSGPAELAVEAGRLTVWIDGFVADKQSMNRFHADAVVEQGKRLVLTPGMLHTVRNDGPTSAVVLVIATEPLAFRPEPGGNPVATPCLRPELAVGDPVVCDASG